MTDFDKNQLTRKLARIKLLKREIELPQVDSDLEAEAEYPICGGIGGIRE